MDVEVRPRLKRRGIVNEEMISASKRFTLVNCALGFPNYDSKGRPEPRCPPSRWHPCSSQERLHGRYISTTVVAICGQAHAKTQSFHLEQKVLSAVLISREEPMNKTRWRWVTVPSRTLPEEQPEHLPLTERYASLTGTGAERGPDQPETCTQGLRSQASGIERHNQPSKSVSLFRQRTP